MTIGLGGSEIIQCWGMGGCRNQIGAVSREHLTMGNRDDPDWRGSTSSLKTEVGSQRENMR